MEQTTEVNAEKTLNEVEKEHIARVLDFTKGEKTKAAQILGISRAGLYAKLKRHNLIGGVQTA